MPTTTVRIREETYRALREMAEESEISISELIAQAVENLRRQRLLERSNAAYGALRADPAAWEMEQEERRAWETTLQDGMSEW